MTEIRESEKNYGKIVQVSKNSELITSERREARKAIELAKQKERENLILNKVGDQSENSPKISSVPVKANLESEKVEVGNLRISDYFPQRRSEGKKDNAKPKETKQGERSTSAKEESNKMKNSR